MSLFTPKHQHQWKLTGARYHPRPERLLSAEGMTQTSMAEVLHGFTLLTQQCTGCGWVETTRTPGKADITGLGLAWAPQEVSA